jgi:hypothetical protein
MGTTLQPLEEIIKAVSLVLKSKLLKILVEKQAAIKTYFY